MHLSGGRDVCSVDAMVFIGMAWPHPCAVVQGRGSLGLLLPLPLAAMLLAAASRSSCNLVASMEVPEVQRAPELLACSLLCNKLPLLSVGKCPAIRTSLEPPRQRCMAMLAQFHVCEAEQCDAVQLQHWAAAGPEGEDGQGLRLAQDSSTPTVPRGCCSAREWQSALAALL